MIAVKIKVCGLTLVSQVEQLATMGVDYAGFIFYEKSPRYVVEKLTADDVKGIKGIKKVGVFVNENPGKVWLIAEKYGLDFVQLHGDENSDDVQNISTKIATIKAFRLNGDEKLSEMLEPFSKFAHSFLFDTKAKEYGGTGKKFDWSVLENHKIERPFFLSGGIGVRDAEQVKEFLQKHRKKNITLDLNSRFESAPGIKDLELLKKFIGEIKNPRK
jgi:phosphoribosylanthranilate isomerase